LSCTRQGSNLQPKNDAAWLAELFAAFASYQQLPTRNALRIAAESLRPILAEIDWEMSQSKNSSGSLDADCFRARASELIRNPSIESRPEPRRL
jgi:hypothetical protein